MLSHRRCPKEISIMRNNVLYVNWKSTEPQYSKAPVFCTELGVMIGPGDIILCKNSTGGSASVCRIVDIKPETECLSVNWFDNLADIVSKEEWLKENLGKKESYRPSPPEVLQTNKYSILPMSDIVDVAFIFLLSEIITKRNYTISVGMRNAYCIRYRWSVEQK